MMDDVTRRADAGEKLLRKGADLRRNDAFL
jgi:hypothetical protein